MELYRKFPKVCLVICSLEVMIYAGQIFGWSALLYILKDEGFYAYVCGDNLTGDISFHGSKFSDGNTYLLPENGSSFLVSADPSRFYSSHDQQEHINQSVLIQDNNSDIILPYGKNTSDFFVRFLYKNNSYNNNNTFKNGKNPAYSIFQEPVNGHESLTKTYSESCPEQDSKLNLWFSLAVGFAYTMCAFLGPLMRKFGMRLFRIFFIIVYIIGAVCLGFATPEFPWLICPGLCCIAISGMALYSTNLQVSFLFLNIQSTITASLVGIFDVSTIIKQLVKIAFYHNISREVSYIALAVLLIALGGTSTIVFLPSVRFELNSSDRKKKVKIQDKSDRDEKERFVKNEKMDESDKQPLRASVCSSQYILHLYWMSIMALRFVSFIGFLNNWLAKLFTGNKAKETYYLGVFSYTTLGTVVTAITAGLIHDSQRWRYADNNEYRRRHMPIILPLTVTSLLSVLCTVLAFVEKDGCLYATFIIFTFFRSYVFSFEVTFINDAFPLIHFTQLFGILQLFAGLGSILQYGLFEWFEAYSNAPIHVNIFLLIVELSTLLHPLNIWYQCRQHKRETIRSDHLRHSIEISPELADTEGV